MNRLICILYEQLNLFNVQGIIQNDWWCTSHQQHSSLAVQTQSRVHYQVAVVDLQVYIKEIKYLKWLNAVALTRASGESKHLNTTVPTEHSEYFSHQNNSHKSPHIQPHSLVPDFCQYWENCWPPSQCRQQGPGKIYSYQVIK